VTAESPPLPKLLHPPIVEVALSVQFEPLTELHAAHFGLLWERFRRRFPKTLEQAPINRVIEEFDARPRPDAGIQFELVDKPPMPRCWFLDDAENLLIQVQQDRFAVNWRKSTSEQEYPHFQKVLDLFTETFAAFLSFVQDEQIGEVRPDQCEVTYIDHLTQSGVWEHHGQLDRVLTTWRHAADEYLPLEPENVRFAAQYQIPGTMDETPAGRLHVQAQPAYRRSDGQPIIVLTTIARGRPLGDRVDGIPGFFEIGHKWAVRAFAAFTSPAMQATWGRM